MCPKTESPLDIFQSLYISWTLALKVTIHFPHFLYSISNWTNEYHVHFMYDSLFAKRVPMYKSKQAEKYSILVPAVNEENLLTTIWSEQNMRMRLMNYCGTQLLWADFIFSFWTEYSPGECLTHSYIVSLSCLCVSKASILTYPSWSIKIY